MKRILITALATLCIVGGSVHAQANPGATAPSVSQLVQQGQQLLQANRHQEAYDLFLRYENEHSGSVRFDYWYGVAALRADRPFESSLALERVITQQPTHAGARLELAGVYLRLNRLDAAERQLDFLEGLNPPPRAQEAMFRLRDAIAARRAGDQQVPQIFMFGLDFGYDSNYLNYPDSFDLFANTILQGIAILEADDTTYTTARAMWWRRFGSDSGYLETSLMGQSRKNHNSDASIFDTHVIHGMATAGTRFSGQRELRFGFEAAQLWLDNERYRHHTGLNLGYRQPLGERGELHVNTHFRDFRFDRRRNDYVSWGGDLEYRLQLNNVVRLRGRTGFDAERVTRDPTRQGGDSDRLFVTGHADFQLGMRNQIQTMIGYENHRYDQAAFSIFNLGQPEIRDDDSLRARLEWIFQPTPHWRFSLFGQYREQTSSIDFFELDQTLVQGSVTYVF